MAETICISTLNSCIYLFMALSSFKVTVTLAHYFIVFNYILLLKHFNLGCKGCICQTSPRIGKCGRKANNNRRRK